MRAFPDDIVEQINARLGGLNRALGLRFVSATPDELVAELEIDDQHRHLRKPVGEKHRQRQHPRPGP